MKQQIKNYLIVLAAGIAIALVLAFATGFTQQKVVYVEQTYTVTKLDCLQGIAERFIIKNTGSVRRVDEFAEGIKELNYSVIGDGDVKCGETLIIGYWERR